MDRELIHDKLASLRRCIQRVEQWRPVTASALANDADAQDILSLNLTRAVQLCVDIAAHIIADRKQEPPATMAGSFEQLAEQGILTEELAARLRSAVGFRNIAVHEYQAINWDIVFAIVHDRLGDFKAFARAIVTYLDAQPS